MPINSDQCQAFWASFVQSLADNDPRRRAKYDTFGFGSDAASADELAALVLSGKKRATTSLPIEYTSLNEDLPKAGDLSIILNGEGLPVGIIERISVDLVPFGSVDAEYAAYEGEGDGSLQYWQQAHIYYFNGVCRRLGGTLEDTTAVLCQRFKLVWSQSGESFSDVRKYPQEENE